MQRRKSRSGSMMQQGRKAQGERGSNAVLIASSAAMLIGVAIVVYGYLSYHNPTVWIGIMAVMVGLWWAALRSGRRSPFDVHMQNNIHRSGR